MDRPSLLLERETPLKGIVAQVVTMLNGQTQRANLPVRTARLLQRSRAQTPASDCGVSDGSTSPAPASLLQDVVDIKTLLLQLKRVLHEPEEEHHSMSSETLDPLLAACAELPARNNGRRLPPASPLHPDTCADLKRQILYLQGQLEERDRLVRVLQQQMSKMSEVHITETPSRNEDTCNVATQTDRLRPPIGTALTNPDNSGLVSWNEQPNGKLSTYNDAQKNKRSTSNGTIPKCQCGARKMNGHTNSVELENGYSDVKPNNVHLRNNSRVGSRYLQALANKGNEDNKQHTKRDSSVTERTTRKPILYSNRSKSIENFQNQSLTTFQSNTVKENITKEELLKLHTSYGDLYNGRISLKEVINGNSPVMQNSQSTDTDYSSDGGYKSLPSSIRNCNGYTPKKISGIPRRSIDKFYSAKHVKASAV